MPNHIHLIFRSDIENPSGFLRDFKGYTSKKIIKAIENNPRESRKEWLRKHFLEYKNSNHLNVWQNHNKPIELWSTSVIKQKLDYIHNNPVQAGFVLHSWDWKYSSARNYANLDSMIEIDSIGFLK